MENNKREVSITWEELQVGDEFLDGAIVTNIEPWQMEKCYVLTIDGFSIIASETHMLKCLIKLHGEVVNGSLVRSALIREDIGMDDNWVCCADIHMFANPSLETEIVMLTNGEEIPLDSIELYKNGEPQKVRCISTTTGEYLIGSFVSHNTGGKGLDAKKQDVISSTFDAVKSSPIIQAAQQAETTEEARRIIFEGLKAEYKKEGIAMDDYNIEVIAKKLTSYKRDKYGTRYVEDGEKCDIISICAVGNFGNPWKKAELSSPYKHLTRPGVFEINPDAANEIMF